MRKLCLTLLPSLMLLAVSCAKTGDGPEIRLSVKNDAYFTYMESVAECMERADYAFTCTVAEVGDAFLFSYDEIPDDLEGEALRERIRDIRTPAELVIHDIFYDSTGRLQTGDTLRILQYYGVYDGCRLESSHPVLEAGHDYLLFVAIAPDGETNIVISQGTAELIASGTSSLSAAASGEIEIVPLENPYIYENLHSLSDIASAVAAADQ